MGAWSLGSSPDKWTEILHQTKQRKMLRRCQPFELQAGTSEPCILACRMISRGLKLQGGQLSSTESLVDSPWTSFQETRLAGNGSLREKDYTFFWQGKQPDEPRLHGVGFAVKNSEHLFLLGDFNARVGDDHDSWPTCLGHYGTGKINEN